MGILKNSFIGVLIDMFAKGKCDNLSDQTAGHKFEEFFVYELSKCKSYSVAADHLGITKEYLKVIISRLNITAVSIAGIKEKLLLPSQIEQIKSEISNSRKR